jgi:hypothetical protein
MTMTEVMLAVSVLAISFISLGGAVMTGLRGTSDMDKRNVTRNQALRYMERLNKLSYGSFSDPTPTPDQLNQLFQDQVALPQITLCQVATPVDQDGRKFRIGGFEARGIWEVLVNRDVNGNGVVDADETLSDLLRVSILFDDQIILTTFRSMPIHQQ